MENEIFLADENFDFMIASCLLSFSYFIMKSIWSPLPALQLLLKHVHVFVSR